MPRLLVYQGNGAWANLGDIKIHKAMGEKKESLYKPRPWFSEHDTYRDKLWNAYYEWQSRKHRIHKPQGIFVEQFEKQWWPKPIECRECCREIAMGKKWGFALLKHCSTYPHVANLFEIDPTHLRSMHYFIYKHIGSIKMNDSKNILRYLNKLDPFIRNAAMSAALGKHPL